VWVKFAEKFSHADVYGKKLKTLVHFFFNEFDGDVVG